MNVIEELATYLDAKKEYESYEADAGEYSPWKARLYERLSDAHIALDKAIDQRIDARINAKLASTGLVVFK